MCCGLEAISLQYVLWTAGDQSTICIVDWRGSVCNMCCGLEAISLQYVLWTGGDQSAICAVDWRGSVCNLRCFWPVLSIRDVFLQVLDFIPHSIIISLLFDILFKVNVNNVHLYITFITAAS